MYYVNKLVSVIKNITENKFTIRYIQLVKNVIEN